MTVVLASLAVGVPARTIQTAAVGECRSAFSICGWVIYNLDKHSAYRLSRGYADGYLALFWNDAPVKVSLWQRSLGLKAPDFSHNPPPFKVLLAQSCMGHSHSH